MKKLISALLVLGLFVLVPLVSANPLWAHDEPHEQFFDQMYYNFGPNGTLIIQAITCVTIGIAIIGFIILYLNSSNGWVQGVNEQ